MQYAPTAEFYSPVISAVRGTCATRTGILTIGLITHRRWWADAVRRDRIPSHPETWLRFTSLRSASSLTARQTRPPLPDLGSRSLIDSGVLFLGKVSSETGFSNNFLTKFSKTAMKVLNCLWGFSSIN